VIGAWVRRHLLAAGRGLAFGGLSLVGLLVFAGLLIVFVLGLGIGLVFLVPAPIEWGRRFTALYCGLTERWCGVAVPPTYRPRPPAPVRRPDGWYRYGTSLYRSPRLPAFSLRLGWVLTDRATWRDLRWMLVNPVTGGALAVLPALLVATGLALPWLAGPAWVPVAVVTAPLGLLIAPATLRGHGWWTRALLTPGRRWWIGVNLRTGRAWRHCLALVRLLALLGLALLGVPMFVLTVVGHLLVLTPGGVLLIPAVIERFRWLAGWRRYLAHEWSTVDIPTPYLPRPPAPTPGPDGLYQVRDHLHRTQQMAAFSQRMHWLTHDRATWRDLLWLGVDPLIGGGLALLPVALVGSGLGVVVLALIGTWFGGTAWWLAAVPVGLALAGTGAASAPALLRLHGRWTRVLLAPTGQARLAQRVQRLTETRADATDSQAAELRRIERDLHDGAQARLIAVGLNLSAIGQLLDKDPVAARELLTRAQATSTAALNELRDLVRGIHPPVLSERGLGDAVRALGLDSPLDVSVTIDLTGRPEPPVESAAYFAIAEALTNAARHSGAGHVLVALGHTTAGMRITVTDDGRGGADPARGSGLRGIERRLGMFDGVLTVTSPRGGPTRLTMEIPCALSSPRTSIS
jgi:signal transduction histidine kinase